MSEALGIVLPQPPCIRRELGRKLTLKYRNGIPPLARGGMPFFCCGTKRRCLRFHQYLLNCPKYLIDTRNAHDQIFVVRLSDVVIGIAHRFYL